MADQSTQPVSRIVTYPDLERGEIHRYEKLKIDKTHYSVRCIETLLNTDGVRCWCSMKPVREDHYKNWLQTHEHVCSPGIPCTSSSFDQFYSSSSPKGHLLNLTEDSLYEDMAMFTGKHNLALDVLSSDDFYQLATKFIAYGISLYDLNNPYQKAKRAFKQLRRDKLRQIFINVAFQKHRKILQKFEELPYVSLALDEGKTANYQNLHFVLESPFTDLPSYPFDTIRMEGGKAVHYVASIMKGFQSLNLTKIDIGTVVCDGNTAQKKAFSPDWRLSLYHKQIPNIKKIIYVPCLCHRVHRAYTTCTERNPELNNIVKRLHEISNLCRENYLDIGALCPAHCDTRWIYDYNIVHFILNRADIIKEIVDDIPIDEFQDLKKALAILKSLVGKFENPKTKFQSAFLLLERAINALLDLDKNENRYAKSLAYSLRNYTLCSKEGGLWALAYCFTRNGRSDFRIRNIKRRNPDVDSLSYFNADLPPDGDDESNYIYSPDAEDIIMTEDGKDVETLDESSTTDSEFYSEPEEETPEEASIPDGSEDSTTTDHEFVNYLNSAKKTLETLLKQAEVPRKKIDDCIQNFNLYMDCEKELFSFMTISKEDFSWTQIRSTISGWEDIADIALRLINSALSEASCERTIKRQRLIHTPRRLNSTKQFLDARLILSI